MNDDYKNYTQNTFDHNNLGENTGQGFKTDAGRVQDIFGVDNPKPFEYQGGTVCNTKNCFFCLQM